MLIDSAGWPQAADANEGQGPLIFELLRNPVARPILRDLDNSWLIRQGLVSAFPVHPELVDDAMVARYAELSRAPGHRDILLGLMSGSPPLATPERLAEIAAPTLVMHGREDNLIPLSSGEKFHASIAGSEFVALDGIGHAPQEEVPDRSAQIVRSFLRTAHAVQAPRAGGR